jgi:hypothetical protein
MIHNYKSLIKSDVSSGDTLFHCILQGADMTGVELVTASFCNFADSIIPDTWILSGCITGPTPQPEPDLPDLEETARNVAVNAFTRPVETMQALLEQAPIDNAIALYNSDGVIRIVKAGE